MWEKPVLGCFSAGGAQGGVTLQQHSVWWFCVVYAVFYWVNRTIVNVITDTCVCVSLCCILDFLHELSQLLSHIINNTL